MPEIEVIDADALHQSGSWLFEGADHGGVGLSFFLIDSLPGAGPDLHAHPYTEVFVVHEGEATFVLGDQSLVAGEGQGVVAPADRPHNVHKSGATPLPLTKLHPTARPITHGVVHY